MKWSLILFLAVFLGVIALGLYIWHRIRKKVRAFSLMAFGTPELLEGFRNMEAEAETTPRSLSGCDDLLLPRIRADFPDFDPGLAKTCAREALQNHLSDLEGVVVHNIVLSRYERSRISKTVVMQAAAQHREEGRIRQERYILNYVYTVQGKSGEHTAAANCPNCGGVIEFGQTSCAYCGSQIAAIMQGAWEITEIREG